MKHITIAAVIAAFFMLLCSPANAQAPANTPPADETYDMFKDWNTMKNYMLSQGLDAGSVNWEPIDQLCSGIKLDRGEREFNKCAYERARDSILYAADKTQCLAQSHGVYPDNLLKSRTDILTETDKEGVSHTFQRTITPILPQDLSQQRSGAFAECMQKLGWVDANNWRPGKRSAYCQ